MRGVARVRSAKRPPGDVSGRDAAAAGLRPQRRTAERRRNARSRPPDAHCCIVRWMACAQSDLLPLPLMAPRLAPRIKARRKWTRERLVSRVPVSEALARSDQSTCRVKSSVDHLTQLFAAFRFRSDLSDVRSYLSQRSAAFPLLSYSLLFSSLTIRRLDARLQCFDFDSRPLRSIGSHLWLSLTCRPSAEPNTCNPIRSNPIESESRAEVVVPSRRRAVASADQSRTDQIRSDPLPVPFIRTRGSYCSSNLCAAADSST